MIHGVKQFQWPGILWLLCTVFDTYRHKDFGHNKRSLSVVLAGYKKF
jgi:hypothetical protein